jgi:hypothetical protein
VIDRAGPTTDRGAVLEERGTRRTGIVASVELERPSNDQEETSLEVARHI